MDPLPGPARAPGRRPALGVGQVGEGLPGEEAAAHELDRPLDAGLVGGRRTRAGSITKPRSWAYSAKARLSRGSSGWARSTTAAMLSGIDDLEDPAEERPRRLEPGDDRRQVLAEAQPHKAVPASRPR